MDGQDKPLKLKPREEVIGRLREWHKSRLKIGQRMPDFTIYAGISPTTQQPMFVAPAVSEIESFNLAMKHAETLKFTNGIGGFRVPDRDELQVIFNNRDKGELKKIFNATARTFWSSTLETEDSIWTQRSSDGKQVPLYKNSGLSTCYIR